MPPSALEELLFAARQKASRGDVDRAALLYDQAIWKADQKGLEDVYLDVVKEAIGFYENERFDQKLIFHGQRFLSRAKVGWEPDDPKQLTYMDKLTRAYYRTQDHIKLEQTILESLCLQKKLSGERSSAYANRLEYSAAMLVDSGKKEMAAKFKQSCRDIRNALKKVAESKDLETSSRMLLVDKKVYLGIIMTESKVIPEAVFKENLQAAKQLGMHVGEVLVSAGLINYDQLYMALQLQSLVRSRKTNIESAAAAFGSVFKNKLSLEEALSIHGLSDELADDMNRLGRILESAGLIKEMELESAIDESRKDKMPLARYLVTKRLVSATVVAQALEIQGSIRSGSMSREAGINKLKSVFDQKKQTVSRLKQTTK